MATRNLSPELTADALRRYAHSLLLSICHRCPYERALALRAWVRAARLPGWDVRLRMPGGEPVLLIRGREVPVQALSRVC